MKEWIKAIVIAAAIMFLVTRVFIVAEVSGHSMDPTLFDGEHTITAKHSRIKKGDIVGFNFETTQGSEYHVKRIIGMPGDIVKVTGDEVYVNDKEIISNGEQSFPTSTYQLADDEYFVVGDNYSVSYDSRSHGPIHKDDLLGEIIIRLPF